VECEVLQAILSSKSDVSFLVGKRIAFCNPNLEDLLSSSWLSTSSFCLLMTCNARFFTGCVVMLQVFSPFND